MATKLRRIETKKSPVLKISKIPIQTKLYPAPNLRLSTQSPKIGPVPFWQKFRVLNRIRNARKAFVAGLHLLSAFGSIVENSKLCFLGRLSVNSGSTNNRVYNGAAFKLPKCWGWDSFWVYFGLVRTCSNTAQAFDERQGNCGS